MPTYYADQAEHIVLLRDTLRRFSANHARTCAVESSMAKMFVTDHGLDIVIKCQQVLGAYGCAEEYDMERYVRDMTCLPTVGGSSNMQRNNIANRLRLGRS